MVAACPDGRVEHIFMHRSASMSRSMPRRAALPATNTHGLRLPPLHAAKGSREQVAVRTAARTAAVLLLRLLHTGFLGYGICDLVRTHTDSVNPKIIGTRLREKNKKTKRRPTLSVNIKIIFILIYIK